MTRDISVLNIEDSKSNSALIAELLHKGGYKVIFKRVETAAQMRAALKKRTWDVIISDLNLSKFDSYSALALLHEERLDIPFIIISDPIGEEAAIDLLKAGAHDLLIKKNLTRLLPAVERELEYAQVRRERKHSEDAALVNQNRFRALIENSLGDISLVSADGTLIWESPSVIHPLNYPPNELLGTNIFELLHPDDLEQIQNLFAEIVGEPASSQSGSFRLRRKDGNWRWVEAITSNLLHDPSVQAIVINYRDVTERKTMENEIASREQNYRSIMAQASDGIFTVNPTGKFTDINPSGCAMLGYTFEELFTKKITDLFPIEDLTAAPLRTDELRQGKTVLSDRRLLHKDGTLLEVEISVRMLSDGSFQGILHDISERKQAEDSLRESEQKYRSLYALAERREKERTLIDEVSRALVHELDLTRILHTVVEVISRTFGYTLVSLYLLQDETLVLQHQIGYSNVIREIPITKGVSGRVARSGLPLLIEDVHAERAFVGAIENIVSEVCVPLLHEDQVIGILNVESAHKTKLSEADLNLMITLSEHISSAISRAKLYSELGDNEKRFRALIENSADAIALVDVKGTVIYDSPAAPGLLGYAPEERIGKSIFELIHTDDLAEIRELLQELPETKGSRVRATFRLLHKNNSWRWVEAVATNLLDQPSVKAIVVNYRDITEKKQAENALRESEEHHRNIFENATVGIYHSTPEGRYISVNPAMAHIYGYDSPEEMLVSVTDIASQIHANPASREEFKRLLVEHEQILEFINQNFRKDGSLIWTSTNAQVMKDKEGRILYYEGFMTNITERKNLEIALLRSEQTYRTLFENVPVGLYRTSADGVWLDANPALVKMFGYQDRESFLAVKVENVYVDPVTDKEFLEAAARSDTISSMEAEFCKKDGTTFWAEDHVRVIRDVNENPLYYEGSLTDITERKRSEEALLASESSLQGILQSTADGILAVNAENKVLFTNEHFAEMWKIPQDVISRKDDATLLQYVLDQLTDPEEFINKVQELYQSEQESFDILYFKDGRIFERLSKPIMYKENSAGRVWSFRDITERKHSEEALRESEERFRSLFNRMLDGVYRSKHEGKFVDVNPAMVKMFGYSSREEMLAVDIKNELYFEPEERGSHILDTGHEETDVYRMRRKDGSEIWVEDHGSYVHDEQGNIIYHEGILRDITERKRSEEALNKTRSDYQRLFNHANDVILIFEPEEEIILDVNAAACAIYGFSRDELIGMSLKKLTLNVTQGEAQIRDTLENRSYHDFESIHINKNGQKIYFLINASVVEYQNKEAILSINHDITERKRAEESLRGSEQRYRALFEDMPLSIWEEDFSEAKKYLDSLKDSGVTDFRTYFKHKPEAFLGCATMIRILDVNQATLKMYHAESKEDLYKSMDEGLNESEVEHILDALIAISEGKVSHSWEGIDETVTGESIDVSLSWSVSPGHESDFSKVIVTTIDISERKKAEEALRESEERFRAIFEGAAIGIAIVDLSGHTIENNLALENLLGYDSTEFSRMVFTDFTHPEDIKLDWNLWQDLVSRKLDHYRIEKRFIHKDGHIIWVNLATSSVRTADGQMLFGVGMVEDITERKKAETDNKYQLSELEALYENGLAISSLLEPRQIAQRMVEVIDQKLDWHHAAIRLYDASTDRIEVLALNFPGLNQFEMTEQIERINKTINAPDKGLSGWVLQHGEVLRIGNLIHDPRYVETYPGISSGLYVPIKSADEVIGSIAVESEVMDAFTERDAHTLSTLASQAAISFVNARLYQQIQNELKERHQAEEEVRKLNIELEQRVIDRTDQIEATKRRLELATHAGQIGVWEYSLRENKVIWDERMHLIYKLARDEFDGTAEAWAQVIHPEDLEKSQLGRNQSHTNNPLFNNEYRIIWPDGSVRHIMASAVMVYSLEGIPERLIGINMDITDRKQIEQSLRESENYTRVLFNAIPDPISVTEVNGSILDINKAFEKQFNQAHEDLVGKHISDLGIYPQNELDKQSEYLSEVLQGHLIESVELDFYVPGDRVHTHEFRAFPLSIEGDQVVLNTSHDITAHKKAEEAQRIAKSEMERALRIKNEFLANMSHELRTPLNSILGISESLEEQIAGALNEKQLKYIGIVRESGRHLLELINDILDLSKIEAGQMKLEIHPVSIEKLCQVSLRMIKELAQKKSLNVSYKTSENGGVISGDERRLKQSLVNLLTNAVKFTPPGSRIGLEVQGNSEKNEMEFTVWDQGIGIAPADIQQLFKPFVQLDAGLTREYQGTGLGLALVAQMVELHGGRVRVDSELRSGSRFTITLPWLPGEQNTKPKVTDKLSSVPIQEANKNTNRRILLVEDTDVVVQLVSEYLRYKGYEVLLAHNGAEGVQMAIEEHPDLILMDVMMPYMNGLEATQNIRMDESLKDTPIIAMTALAMSGDSEKCIAAGMNDYLSKPIQMKHLADMIEKYMGPAGEKSNEK